MVRILIVEDDILLRDLISRVLERNNYKAYEASNGILAMKVFDEVAIDLVITDVMMPKMDGFELVNLIRKIDNNMPILMITAMDQYQSKEVGFSVGVDDYMVKPVDIKELLLRVKALLRRSKIANENQLTIEKTTLYYDELRVEDNNQSLILPQKEFYLLYKLLSYPNKIFTRMQLMDDIWGMDSDSTWRTIDVHINRLRDRLLDFNDFDIITVRGIGYKAVKNIGK